MTRDRSAVRRPLGRADQEHRNRRADDDHRRVFTFRSVPAAASSARLDRTVLIAAHLTRHGYRNQILLPKAPGLRNRQQVSNRSIRACQAGHRVAFATAAGWVDRLAEAHAAGRRHAELTLGRYPLLVLDEVVSLKGDSCRLKDRDLGRVPATATEEP